jgi:hypothetical protein
VAGVYGKKAFGFRFRGGRVLAGVWPKFLCSGFVDWRTCRGWCMVENSLVFVFEGRSCRGWRTARNSLVFNFVEGSRFLHPCRALV